MLEAIINPSSAERRPWKMFFIGLVYASLSLLLVYWFFSKDEVLSKFSGIMIVTFCVMFSLPFMYRMIRREEKVDEHIDGFLGIWKAHSDVIFAFLWLFLGFIIAFSFWNVVLQNSNMFNAQIQTYCLINNPDDMEGCIQNYMFTGNAVSITGSSTDMGRFLSILENNFYVMIFTLIFSLIFGAGAIFVLAWNATVIAAAIGIFAKYQITNIPMGIARYMIHGFPEIAAYFVTALAGGIFGVGFLRHGWKDRKFLRVFGNVIALLLIAIIILIVAAIMEVYLTPRLFG
jgi:uncharacterized membrane protein SpoIIM required for sporulation